MPYLILNPDNTIEDVLHDDPGGGVFISKQDMQPIVDSKHGHIEFRYINGALVHNPTVAEAIEFEQEKVAFEKEIVRKEQELMARERLSLILPNIRAAKTKAELDALKRGS